MVQNKQSLSTFPASLSSSLSSPVASSMAPPTSPPSLPGFASTDPAASFQNIFGAPAASHHPRPSSSASSMGQVVSRPQVSAALSPSSAPSSLGVSPSNAGNRFKRAFTGRRKKSDTVTLPSPRPDKRREPQAEELLEDSSSTAPRQLGAKQLTLQLAHHVFNKKSAPASPALSGLSLPPPPPPPKHVQQPILPPSRLTPINTNVDKRISVITTSSPIAPALDYMRKSEDHTEQKENERRDLERSEFKEVRRKSDSTLSLRTIRAAMANKSSRPVSYAESLQSTHTVVPVNKRLSALLTDPEFVMAEEEDGSRIDEKGRAVGRPSPASSLRLRNRRSQSLTFGPPSSMISGATVSNAAMSLEAVTVTLPRSASEGRERERIVPRELTTITSSSLPSNPAADSLLRHASAVSSLNQVSSSAASRIERNLPDLPDTPQKLASPPLTHSPPPSFRQTAISMTSGFAPAAGLARRAVERMGRVWGSKSSFSIPHTSPLGESSSLSRIGPPSRASSSNSESPHYGYGRKGRHYPQTPSVSSTTSSLSDYEGPQLGSCLRSPIRILPSGNVVGGLVFGRELKTCVEETAVDSVRNVLHTQNVPHDGQEKWDVLGQRSQPSSPLESRRVPALVVRCAQHIFAWGVQEQGLFRVNGRASHINKLRAEFDTGADFNIVESNPGDLDPHAVAAVFKAYLRELPEPILTNQLLPYFDAAMTSERLANNIQDLSPSNNIQGLRKPPSLSTLGMPNFGGTHPPSESLRKALSSLVSHLPQENRDLLLTVTEVINHTAKRSSETKMPLSNLLLVLCPSLSLSPSLLHALCESQGVWKGVHQLKEVLDLDVIAGEISQSIGCSEVPSKTEDAVGTNSRTTSHLRPSKENERFVRPLPKLPTSPGSTSTSVPSSTSSGEPLGLPIRIDAHNGASRVPLDAETSSSSFSTTDDDSSISHFSQSGRPVTPSSLNFKLADPHSPPSLSCSTDSSSIPSSSGSPIQLVKPLTLLDECIEQSSNSPHSLRIAHPIPLPIPSLRPAQTVSELLPQFQFPGPGDNITRNPHLHRKSTPSLSFSSSISGEARSASMASRARRMKKPSLHLLFSKHSASPISSPVVGGPLVTVTTEEGGLRSSSSTPGSSPDSMVTAPQSSRFSYPPVLNTSIDESSISLALGIENDGEDRTTSIHATEIALQGLTESGAPLSHGLPTKDTEFRHLDVTLLEDEQLGEYNWTQSVLMAAAEPRW